MIASLTSETLSAGRIVDLFKQLTNLMKLRIGVVMMLTALVAMAVTPGQPLSAVQVLVLAYAVLISAGSAGAFNQYYEIETDRVMKRTQNRPFVTGRFQKSPMWLLFMMAMLVAGLVPAALLLNMAAAFYIFLGAFFYAIVYTVWLKRRSTMNIVIGGASGSFAVLAGAAAVDPVLSPVPVFLAIVLFLWTPSHFWSLAIAKKEEYAKVGVPMLPVVIGNRKTTVIVLINTLLLVGFSIMPFFYGMSWIYLACAVSGGAYFIYENLHMIADSSPKIAMRSFFASLLQLVLLLMGAVLDVVILG